MAIEDRVATFVLIEMQQHLGITAYRTLSSFFMLRALAIVLSDDVCERLFHAAEIECPGKQQYHCRER